MTNSSQQKQLLTALEWYVDNGLSCIVGDEPVDRTVLPSPAAPVFAPMPTAAAPQTGQDAPAFLGKSDAYDEAVKLAAGAKTLEELRDIIQSFDGIAIKKTASNMVFADGNPKADIMIIGEAPEAEEDRVGKPFVGASGELLDKIVACIGLSRESEKPEEVVYLSNILNWRPPGNRTPNPSEIEVSLPFIERHIQLVQPKVLILFGSVAAKALLDSTSGISRLRKNWHDYAPRTKGVGDHKMHAIATYHPSDLLRTPNQKKAVWMDMLMLQDKMQEK